MKVALAYGKGKLEVELAGAVDVIEPLRQPGLPDERSAVFSALDHPIGSKPLHEWIGPSSSVCITFTDLTRPTPNERLIPWLLEYLHSHGIQRKQITLLNQLGTHRPNTRAELELLLTPEVVRNYRVINHEPANRAELIQLGKTESGAPALINRHFVSADVRIVTGFIEPHLFAGFSGGVKCVMPGVAGLETIMSNHGYRHIADPLATFGVTEGNPVWEEMRAISLRTGESFLLNVSLNNDREVTGLFAGHLLEAHKAGCEFVRASAMQRIKDPYDIVVTTNSGYPLDLNLYQTAKGMGAAARIVRKAGVIIVASECCEGIPSRSAFDKILRSVDTPSQLLSRLHDASSPIPDQWQAQIQAICQEHAEVFLYSQMPDEDVQGAHLTPCHDIAGTIQSISGRRGRDTRIAVLPYGPLTIPYLDQKTFK